MGTRPSISWTSTMKRCAARAELGTKTIKETVNQALRRAGAEERKAVGERLDVLARADLVAREQAWR